MKIGEIFKFVNARYEIDGRCFVLSTLMLYVLPSVFLQFLAFGNGEAFSDDGEGLACPEWENVPYVVLQEVRELFFSSYPRIMNGDIKPDADGFCFIQDISDMENPINTGFRSECGMIGPHEKGRIIDAWQFPAE